MYLCFCGFNDEANYKEAYTRNPKAQTQWVTLNLQKKRRSMFCTSYNTVITAK